MLANLTTLIRTLASGAVHCLMVLVHDPICIIDLLVAGLYLAAILALLSPGHRWMWLVYLGLATAHVVAAVAHGGAHP